MVLYRSPDMNCAADRLTPTLTGSGQPAASRQARRNTQLPSSPDYADVLGDPYEVSGADNAAFWMAPAQQRFAAAEVAARKGDPRLIEQLELLLFERCRQFPLELVALHGGPFDVGIEEAEVIAASALGAIEREIGVP